MLVFTADQEIIILKYKQVKKTVAYFKIQDLLSLLSTVTKGNGIRFGVVFAFLITFWRHQLTGHKENTCSSVCRIKCLLIPSTSSSVLGSDSVPGPGPGPGPKP